MLFRGLIHRHIRVVGNDRRCLPPLGRWTRYALYFAILCGVWVSFKQVEPTLFPVVKDFQITHTAQEGGGVLISGTFRKVRGCEPVEVLGYSGNKYVAVVFPRYPIVTRLQREQTFGPWKLVPKVSHLDLYARHICYTGSVTTKIFSGVLVL